MLGFLAAELDPSLVAGRSVPPVQGDFFFAVTKAGDEGKDRSSPMNVGAEMDDAVTKHAVAVAVGVFLASHSTSARPRKLVPIVPAANDAKAAR